MTIPAIHLHVVRMHNAQMEYVHAFPNITVIHILDVALNVYLIPIVQEIKLAFEASVLIHVQELVHQMQSAK